MVGFWLSKDLGFVAGSSGYIRSEKVFGQACLNTALLYFGVHRVRRKVLFLAHCCYNTDILFLRALVIAAALVLPVAPRVQKIGLLLSLYYGYIPKSRASLLH